MQKRRILIIILAIGILVIFRQLNDQKKVITHHLTGTTMGKITYSVKYLGLSQLDFQKEVDSILVAFNQSLSTYIPDSEISLFNRTDTIVYSSSLMFRILDMSQELFKNSNGAYDPTVGPLVNAWGFGPKKKSSLDSAIVDSLLQIVGFNDIQFNSISATKPSHSYLDFSASAKGFAVDVIADFLISNNIHNYMIEIGGEVKCLGQNDKGTVWKIGIEKPEMTQERGNLFATVFIKDRALATSGNYRNYYQKGNQIISHTINPFTGYSVSHNLLSASIFAPSCAMADGYATACMVMGLEKSIEMIENMNEVDGFFMYSSENGKLDYHITPGIASQLEILN